jgi:hypothetical protein
MSNAAGHWERGKDEFAELFVGGEGLARGAFHHALVSGPPRRVIGPVREGV